MTTLRDIEKWGDRLARIQLPAKIDDPDHKLEWFEHEAAEQLDACVEAIVDLRMFCVSLVNYLRERSEDPA